MKYRCRFLKPNTSEWFEVEAESPGEAAQTLHSSQGGGFSYRHELEDGKAEYITFALVEVDGQELISRMYEQGILRRGGRKYPPLTELAHKLGYKGEPSGLIGKWEGEEPEWTGSGDMVSRDRRKVVRL
jgi:hypothetical protein